MGVTCVSCVTFPTMNEDYTNEAASFSINLSYSNWSSLLVTAAREYKMLSSVKTSRV